MVAEPNTSERVGLDQRFRRAGDCPICEGGDSVKRRRGERCAGFLSSDGHYAFCTREEYAGGLPLRMTEPPSYMHKLDGPCFCGVDHSAGYRPDVTSPRPSTPDAPAPVKITRTHIGREQPDYSHPYGEHLRLLRWGSGAGKKLCWQHFNRDHGWIDSQGPYSPGFYRAEEITASDPRKPVYLAGGEKCVDELVKRGAVAGCNPGGENGKWRDEWSALFTGRHVVILADADAPGRKHAQAIAAGLAAHAASVRMLELEGTHDVADWLADGHTLLELLEITACTLPAQHSSPGSASSTGGADDTYKPSCLNCKRLEERAKAAEASLKIAETSLANLRREQAMEHRILALPKEQLSAPLKPAAIAVREVLSQPKARDEQGMELVYRRAISQRCGVSDETAGTYLRKLAQAGVIRREVRKSFDTSEIHISEGPLFDAPEQIAPTATVWGGKRTKKGCPHCQSIEIVPTTYACTNCGAHLHVDELIDVIVDAAEEQEISPGSASSTGGEGDRQSGEQDAAQDTPLPPDIILRHLAPDAQDTPPPPPARPCIRCRAYDWRHDGERWYCGSCMPSVERTQPYEEKAVS